MQAASTLQQYQFFRTPHRLCQAGTTPDSFSGSVRYAYSSKREDPMSRLTDLITQASQLDPKREQ